MEHIKTTTILEGYSEQEKVAYLGAIAALATADRQASPEELEHLDEIAEAAAISPRSKEEIVQAATDRQGTRLAGWLEVLRKSELRFSLVADMIAFAELDNHYGEEEKQIISKITHHLGVNPTQFSLLDQFVQRSAQSSRTPREMTGPGFLESLGLRDPFAKAGIGARGARGLLGMLGPMIIGGLLHRGMSGRRYPQPYSRGMAPGALGSGGFGSIFSVLNGRQSRSGMGALLSRLLR